MNRGVPLVRAGPLLYRLCAQGVPVYPRGAGRHPGASSSYMGSVCILVYTYSHTRRILILGLTVVPLLLNSRTFEVDYMWGQRQIAHVELRHRTNVKPLPLIFML